MSNVGDALSGSSDASGVNDQTFADASLGDQIMGGDGSIFGGSSSASSGGGPSFNDIVSAFSGGGSPQAAQAATMSPPAAATAAGGDPTGAASGTQSNATPGSTPTPNQGGGGGQQPQHDPDHAPPSAVAELRTLLKQLTGQPTGPTGPLPTLAAGQTGAQSPGLAALRQLTGSQPAAASLEAGGSPPPAGMEPGGARDIRAGVPIGSPSDDFDPATGIWSPRTAAGTLSSQTPLPPPRPADLGQTADAGQGRDITVRKTAEAAGEPPQPEPPAPAPDLPTRVPLPTHKPGPEPAPVNTQPSQLIQDVSGMSTGAPPELADLAKTALSLAPLIVPLIAGLMGGGGRRHHGGFGRFGGFRGGMNAMRYHGGRHPFAPGAWPYHHPQFGWHMHGRPPGPGWLPLNPVDAQSIVGGGQGGPDPNNPPKETGGEPLPPDRTPTSGAIPGVGAKDVDDYTRQTASKWGIDPDTASKILAQESSYGQARRPGDNGTSFGPFQLHFAPDGRAMGDDFMRDTGLDPRDPRTWKQQIDYAMMKASEGGWGPWTTSMKKLGLTQWSGITTNRRFAGQPRTNQQPKWAEKAAALPLPVTSQPMVAGQ